MSSRSRTPEEIELIQDALKRLKAMMKKSPEIAMRVHTHLNRKKGVKLLNELFASTGSAAEKRQTPRFC